MKVSDLISHLQEMPPEAEVYNLRNGFLRTVISHVWLTRSGTVGTADHNEPVYKTSDRPPDAPDAGQKPYWTTGSSPEEIASLRKRFHELCLMYEKGEWP